CGGLHCDRTSRVGPIRILRTKRIQDGVVRIEYSAGLAAVAGMQSDRACIDQLAECMMVPRESVVPAAVKMVAELKEERKKLEAMVARLNESTTDMLLATAEEVGGAKLVVHHAREGEDAMSLAITLMSRPGVIAVVASSVPGVKLIVGRSQDVDMDARPVLKEIMKLIGGGGGGKPDLAQGGGGDPSKVSQALAEAPGIVRAAMAAR
ncbi:MAG TPA: hypothetical protein GXZ80_06980, partial [Euryarchaeota archaeon]|nr:hypothetical protein [Euryarchaeota archaeon]